MTTQTAIQIRVHNQLLTKRLILTMLLYKQHAVGSSQIVAKVTAPFLLLSVVIALYPLVWRHALSATVYTTIRTFRLHIHADGRMGSCILSFCYYLPAESNSAACSVWLIDSCLSLSACTTPYSQHQVPTYTICVSRIAHVFR